jgi:hypothetical protein
MTTQKAYILGFVKRAMSYGFDQQTALDLFKNASAADVVKALPGATKSILGGDKVLNPSENKDSLDRTVDAGKFAYNTKTLLPNIPNAFNSAIDLVKNIPSASLTGLTAGAKNIGSTMLKPKNIPGVGAGLGVAAAGNYARKGDIVGAGLQGVSTLLGTTGVGSAASIPLDNYNSKRHEQYMNAPVANPNYHRPVITENNPITPQANPYSNLPPVTVPRKDLLNIDSRSLITPSAKPQVRQPFQG